MSETGAAAVPPVLRDRDVFKDSDGRVFVTLGYIQPDDRVLSFLKYTKDPEGKWTSGESRYRRVFWGGVNSVIEGLSMLPSHYTTLDPHFDTELVEPPRDTISRYYRPESRLQGIMERGPEDRLEEYAQRAAIALTSTLNIPLERLGVAGSILWSAHNPEFSDVNMNIYGLKESHMLLNSYNRLARDHDDIHLRRLDDWTRAIARVQSRVPVLTRGDLQNLFERRNAVCIDDQCIGITPVLLPNEAPIQHGTERYEAILHEPVRVRMTIEDSTYGPFNPALYWVNSEPIDVLGNNKISRVLVYDGAFSGLFRNGDRVEVSGVPQTVQSPNGQITHYQMMVGTKVGSRKEYIRFVD